VVAALVQQPGGEEAAAALAVQHYCVAPHQPVQLSPSHGLLLLLLLLLLLPQKVLLFDVLLRCPGLLLWFKVRMARSCVRLGSPWYRLWLLSA
jgi:hypothetical protein